MKRNKYRHYQKDDFKKLLQKISKQHPRVSLPYLVTRLTWGLRPLEMQRMNHFSDIIRNFYRNRHKAQFSKIKKI